MCAGLRPKIRLAECLGVDIEDRPPGSAIQLPVELAPQLIPRNRGSALAALAVAGDAIGGGPLNLCPVDVATVWAEGPEELFRLIRAAVLVNELHNLIRALE